MKNLKQIKKEYESKNYADNYPGLSYEGNFLIKTTLKINIKNNLNTNSK